MNLRKSSSWYYNGHALLVVACYCRPFQHVGRNSFAEAFMPLVRKSRPTSFVSPYTAGGGTLLLKAVSSPVKDEDEPSSAYLPFYDFLNDLGWQYGRESTQLARRNGRRGVFARKSIKPGDTILRLPIEAAIVIEPDETTPAEQAWKLFQLHQEQKIMSGEDPLLSSNSHFLQPYWNLLPRGDCDFDPTPDLWSRDQVEALELPELVEEVLERQSDLEVFFQSKLAVDNANDATTTTTTKYKLSWESFQFAHWLVTSRSFSMIQEESGDDEEEEDDDDDADDLEDDNFQVQCVLIPYMDMINHSSNSPNAQLDVTAEDSEESTFYELVALDSISEGEEILISYGTGQDETIDLLMNYGFVPDSNRYDLEVFDEEDDIEWSTTLEEDLQELASLSDDDDSDDRIRNTILRLRIKVKRASMLGQDRIL
jgi:hypothetical protein